MLVVCPIALGCLGLVYEVPPNSLTFTSRPWPAKAVEAFTMGQLAISSAAMILAPFVWGRRWWLAWLAIFVVGFLTLCMSVGASMATTGLWL
jgi:hypothetical protein